MIPHMTGSTRKTIRLLYVTLAIVALIVVASPGSAAGPRGSTDAMKGILGGVGGLSQPDAACPPDGQCFADVTSASPFYEFVNRIYEQDLVSGYACGGVGEPCDMENRPYYRPGDSVTRQQMSKFVDNARRLAGIHIEVITGTIPIFAQTGNNTAISGVSTGGDESVGVSGESSGGKGVYGVSSSGFGVLGESASGIGLFGYSDSGIGVDGHSTSHEGVLGSSISGNGVQGESTSGNGLSGVSSSGLGVEGVSSTGIGLLGYSDSGIGVDGHSNSNAGVLGSSDSGDGVHGESTSSIGVHGESSSGIGMFGYSDSGIGVDGHSTSQAGVLGSSISNDGLSGSSESGNGVYGESTSGLAGYFSGDVTVTGTCCGAASGTYKIDDPVDPANKYLYHSAVQSPDMMDIYNGNVTTDGKGDAVVIMPDYFEALNRDFRYQLTTVGQFAQAMVSSEIIGNRFSIKTDKPNVKVSWQVTGIRQDAYANAHRTPVEQEKPESERGTYLHPTEQGQPASLGVDYAKRQSVQQRTSGKP